MPSLNLPPIESLDVEDLLTLPEGYRYELHEGNLVIMTPSTFWHKSITRRLLLMLHAAGLEAFQDPGVLGDRPRDCRLPDVGVIAGALPPQKASYSNLPGSAYSLVVEVVSENSVNGEYTDKMDWYAKRGIPEYWIVDQTLDRDEDDAHVRILRLAPAKSTYSWERSLLLSELEAEYRAR
ncbi:Uma2 family endonuclease [Paractinoplanes globisporus]|uniref:Uma2 family endonuclease n=1 Tax=Paractinoplanes globisporus TaxID=113565 RepID=A0ABW6WRA2_9ACTN|nr:Uma2 family endonuclease [Actinoplanes globisporus]